MKPPNLIFKWALIAFTKTVLEYKPKDLIDSELTSHLMSIPD